MQKQDTNILKDVLLQFIKEEGLEEGLLRVRLFALWDDMLGATVAKNTRNKYVKDRTLFVQLNSSVVRSQLFMMRREIVAELNKRLGKALIDELVLN